MLILTESQIMQNWGCDNSYTPLVSVRCITYNHEPYIAHALDGFLMQKTNFPFEVIVHDDASTDRTADIIREYEKKFPKIIKPIYEKENQYSKHNGSLDRIVDSALKGKYVAFCEGDDYWIDENKLQMQVDFLEMNPKYGLCFTKAKQFIQKDKKVSKFLFGSYVKDFEDLLQNGNRIPTLTTVVKKELLDKYSEEIKPETKRWLMNDYPMWLYMAHESKIMFIPKATGMYRVLVNSASHSLDVEKRVEFQESYEKIRAFFSEKYEISIKQPNIDEFFIITCLNFGNYKLCKTACTSKISAKYYLIKLASYVPFLFFVLRKIRQLYGVGRNIILQNRNLKQESKLYNGIAVTE